MKNDFFRSMAERLRILNEFREFLWENRLWWMMPIVIIFLGLAILIALTHNASVVPFIYALF